MDRLVRIQGVDDFAEDQLPLATRVAGVYDAFDIVAMQQVSDRPNSIALAFLRFQSEFVWQDRQRVERPTLVFVVHFFGREQLVEVPDRKGHEIGITLEVTFVFGEAAKHAGDIACDTGLLGDDERFTQRSQLR